MMRSVRAGSLALLSALALPAAGATLAVEGDANIYGAGHAVPPEPGWPGAGSLPPSLDFTPGPGNVLTVSDVSGCMTLTDGYGYCDGGDGSRNLYPTAIDSYGGISGILHDTNGFLAGVFLGAAEPANPAPAPLDFRGTALGTVFLTLAPEVGQTFFIGDGKTDTAVVQSFLVPVTASRLYLGFADGYGYGGLPGAYFDNAGSLLCQLDIACAGSVPADVGNTLRCVEDGAGEPVLFWGDLGADEADYRVYRGSAPDPVASAPPAIGTSGGPDAASYVDLASPAAPGCSYYKVRGVGPCGDELTTW